MFLSVFKNEPLPDKVTNFNQKKMFQRTEKNGELIFDDLDAKTRDLKLSDQAKNDKSELNRRKSVHKIINLSEYMSEMETKNPVSQFLIC